MILWFEDNRTSITDANSNQTAFAYDAFGRVTQTNSPLVECAGEVVTAWLH